MLKYIAWHSKLLVLVFGGVLIATPPIGACIWLEQQADQEKKSDVHLRKQLASVASRMLAIIEGGDAGDIVELMSPKGVVFGLDPPPIPLKDIRKQVQHKRGVYCFLFDTKCMREEYRETWGKRVAGRKYYSYRDRLKQSPDRKVQINLYRLTDGWGGEALVFLKGKEKFDPRNTLVFSFGYEDGKWKLTSVTYG